VKNCGRGAPRLFDFRLNRKKKTKHICLGLMGERDMERFLFDQATGGEEGIKKYQVKEETGGGQASCSILQSAKIYSKYTIRPGEV